MNLPKNHVAFKPPFRQPPKQAEPLTFTFTLAAADAPALKSIVDEMSTIIGTRLEGPSVFKKEDAQTRAARALGVLRATIHRQVPNGDPGYDL